MKMGNIQPIILCGKTVFMDGLALILQNNSNFQVVTALDPDEARQRLEAAEPAAIIVDSANGRDWLETLVRHCPNTLIIAVNPENSAVMVYSQDQVRSVDDLKNMILKHSQLRDKVDMIAKP